MNKPEQSHSLIVEKTTGNQEEHQPQLLSLEWTQVQRKRTRTSVTGRSSDARTGNELNKKHPRSSVDENTEEEDAEDDCVNANCRRCIPKSYNLNLSPPSPSPEGNTHRHLSGKVIFCLPDQDCEWFQGYYFPFDNDETDFFELPSIRSPYYGLLCTVKQDVDECLQCTEGGYREIATIKLTLMNDRRNIATNRQALRLSLRPTDAQGHSEQGEIGDAAVESNTILPSNEPTPHLKRISVANVTWVGGDMMSLYKTVPSNELNVTVVQESASSSNSPDSNDHILTNVSVLRMQTTTLYTGLERVSPYVQRYFKGHLLVMAQHYNDQLQQQREKHEPIVHSEIITGNGNCQQQNVIEKLMPDVAIVVGTMDMWVSC